jgi:hypothetical protein
LGGNVGGRQVQELAKDCRGREGGLAFSGLAELAIVSLDIIVGVNEPMDGWFEFKEGRQLIPMGLPGADSPGVLVAPFPSRTRRANSPSSRVNHERFLVFPRHVFQAVADLMDNAALDERLREYRAQRVGESGQAGVSPFEWGQRRG